MSEGALTVWRPPVPLSNPFDDPSMKGRINELNDDEDEIDDDGDVVIDDESKLPTYFQRMTDGLIDSRVSQCGHFQ